MRLPLSLVVAAVALASCSLLGSSGPHPDSEPEAVAVARQLLEELGGAEAWDGARHLHWTFFERRVHWWDKRTGDVRIEQPGADGAPGLLWLMNVRTGEGRVFEDGVELADPLRRAEELERGRSLWANDSDWVALPYRLLDADVVLRDLGPGALLDGRPSRRLEVTFVGPGRNPRGRSVVHVSDETGLPAQWDRYADRDDARPASIHPWVGWRRVGALLLVPGHGGDWGVRVHESLPPRVYRDPAPVEL